MGKIFILIGVVCIVIGIIMSLIGRLPGDIVFKKGNTTVYFPIVTSIVVSIVLSLIMFLFNKFR
ncbi:DUF2905 domain-containing protein [Terribacillus sp. 179-K 1B1 HS]|uniref:DUF2905 domain-containing protein n=1 Tax=Terribacillus sp. 179-K 1B1 HS TaxID=3142388 RepID=UPI0039A0C781